MAGFVSLIDACVLYPAALRDLIIGTAQTGLYRARWTDKIHDEWIRNVLKNRPDLKAAREQVTATFTRCGPGRGVECHRRRR